MYAVYNYAAGSTAANVSADIIKLLTGETNKANLSANCVQANTEIISTVAAGWTVHDAAAATDTQVIKALCQDGTTYKYYKFGCTSTTEMEGRISEDWNATTHTPTNSVASTTYTRGSWSAASGGYIYIYATQKNILMTSYHTSAYQAMGGMSVFEFTRDTVGSSYPPFAQLCQSSASTNFTVNSPTGGAPTLQRPRFKSASAAGDVLASTLGSNPASALAVIGAVYSAGLGAFYRDASEAVNVVIYKVGVSGASSAAGYVQFGELYDVHWAATQLGSPRDEITVGGTTYVLHGYGVGYGYLLVPKA